MTYSWKIIQEPHTYTWIIYIYQSRLRTLRWNCKQTGNAQLKHDMHERGVSLMINPPCNDMTRLDLDNQTRSLQVISQLYDANAIDHSSNSNLWLLIDPSHDLDEMLISPPESTRFD